jgi:hypothetical protein
VGWVWDVYWQHPTRGDQTRRSIPAITIAFHSSGHHMRINAKAAIPTRICTTAAQGFVSLRQTGKLPSLKLVTGQKPPVSYRMTQARNDYARQIHFGN